MARRANGLDLSETFIIVDYSTIKNTSSIQMFYLARVHCGSKIIRGADLAC
jgi:hypothetical protein